MKKHSLGEKSWLNDKTGGGFGARHPDRRFPVFEMATVRTCLAKGEALGRPGSTDKFVNGNLGLTWEEFLDLCRPKLSNALVMSREGLWMSLVSLYTTGLSDGVALMAEHRKGRRVVRTERQQQGQGAHHEGRRGKRDGRSDGMNPGEREFEKLLRRAAKIAEKDRQSPSPVHVLRKKRKAPA